MGPLVSTWLPARVGCMAGGHGGSRPPKLECPGSIPRGNVMGVNAETKSMANVSLISETRMDTGRQEQDPLAAGSEDALSQGWGAFRAG